MAEDDQLPAECEDLFLDGRDEDEIDDGLPETGDCYQCTWRSETGECLMDGPCPDVDVR